MMSLTPAAPRCTRGSLERPPCRRPRGSAALTSSRVGRLALEVATSRRPSRRAPARASRCRRACPCSSGITLPTALAAPVVVGMMFTAAARARRRSLCGRSRIAGRWCRRAIVVMKPCSMPKLSCRTLAIGARQLVVHEALEITWCCAGVVAVVVDADADRGVELGLAGALRITFWRPPSRCLARSVALGEEAGRLDHDVDAHVLPGQLRRDRARQHGTSCRPRRRRPRRPSPPRGRRRDGVVLQEVGERRRSVRSLIATTSKSSRRWPAAERRCGRCGRTR